MDSMHTWQFAECAHQSSYLLLLYDVWKLKEHEPICFYYVSYWL
jgi:hypothetical protein